MCQPRRSGTGRRFGLALRRIRLAFGSFSRSLGCLGFLLEVDTFDPCSASISRKQGLMGWARHLPILKPDLHVLVGHAKVHREPFAQVFVRLLVDVKPMFEHFELFPRCASVMFDLQGCAVRFGSLYDLQARGYFYRYAGRH